MPLVCRSIASKLLLHCGCICTACLHCHSHFLALIAALCLGLLNTTNFGALNDLEPYPHVATSVINYGVPDLAGKSLTRRVIQQRAREIREAIRTFEPRLDREQLVVEAIDIPDRINAVTFVIQGDITAAAQAMPVKFRTHLDPDSASVDVQE